MPITSIYCILHPSPDWPVRMWSPDRALTGQFRLVFFDWTLETRRISRRKRYEFFFYLSGTSLARHTLFFSLHILFSCENKQANDIPVYEFTAQQLSLARDFIQILEHEFLEPIR